ncbi:MAG: hypothetical protein QOG23_5506, partial [Blastocatellia bacterium]|nr:hypothetical protein [Blastocatellia bacterium]
FMSLLTFRWMAKTVYKFRYGASNEFIAVDR